LGRDCGWKTEDLVIGSLPGSGAGGKRVIVDYEKIGDDPGGFGGGEHIWRPIGVVP
jgi:hypothetical protein